MFLARKNGGDGERAWQSQKERRMCKGVGRAPSLWGAERSSGGVKAGEGGGAERRGLERPAEEWQLCSTEGT